MRLPPEFYQIQRALGQRRAGWQQGNRILLRESEYRSARLCGLDAGAFWKSNLYPLQVQGALAYRARERPSGVRNPRFHEDTDYCGFPLSRE